MDRPVIVNSSNDVGGGGGGGVVIYGNIHVCVFSSGFHVTLVKKYPMSPTCVFVGKHMYLFYGRSEEVWEAFLGLLYSTEKKNLYGDFLKKWALKGRLDLVCTLPLKPPGKA